MKTATLTEIADRLKIPRTTVSEWRNQFEEYLPSIGEGRGKRFLLPESLEVFQTIAKMKQANMTQEEITAALQQSFARTIQVTQTEEPALFIDRIEQLTNELKRSNQLKEQELEIRLQEIQEQREFRQSVEEQLVRRNDEVTKALMNLRESRLEAAATTTKRRKWWPFG